MDGRSQGLPASRAWIIGRGLDADIVLSDPTISRRHGLLASTENGWTYRDLGSRCGSWVSGNRIEQIQIHGPVEIHLGGPSGPTIRLDPSSADARAPDRRAGLEPPSLPVDSTLLGRLGTLHPIHGPEFRIGRVPESDLILTNLRASRNHAVVRVAVDGTTSINDVGSSNGTFLNGVAIRSAPLVEGDVVSFGGHVFRYESVALREYLEPDGAWLCAIDLGVTVGRDTRLLHKLSFALEPSALLGLVGPSGSGKTTLLRALTALQPATEGRVLYGGRDLYAAADIRARMGYVPQDDLLHSQLTVRDALGYAAELRFAADVDRASRAHRVDEVLQELGLEERAGLAIARLSGGQRKRTSVAAELLTKPPLLFLDEPTSGLDPGNEEQLTALLRQLADGGRTVVVATHSLVTLEECDRVLFLARGGHQVYYGPPSAAAEYFRDRGRGQSYPRVFVSLGTTEGQSMAAEFQANPAYAKFVERPLAQARRPPLREDVGVGSRHQPDSLGQWWVLVRRYVAVLRADRLASLLLLAQAPFFALLFSLLYPMNIMSTGNASEATILVWLLVVGATWIGTSNAIREVVKELPIIRREYGLGMSPTAYAMSKIAVLGVVTVGECAFLAVAGLLPQTLPPQDPIGGFMFSPSGVLLGPRLVEFAFDLVVAGVAGMAFGLLLSTLVRNADQANFTLPLVLVAQIVLSAPLLGSPGPVFAAIGTVSSAQWGTAASAATMSLNDVRAPYLGIVEQQRAAAAGKAPDPTVAAGQARWNHDLGGWLTDLLALCLLCLGSLLAMRYLLGRLLEPAAVRQLRRSRDNAVAQVVE